MSVVASLRERARPLARFGCASIGTVYVLVGTLAVLALLGRTPEQADEYRLLRALTSVPAGPVLIWTIVAGTAGYVVWRAIEALSDPFGYGCSWPGMAQRVGMVLSGAGYGVIAFAALRIVTGGPPTGGRDGSEEQQQLLVARLLEWPWGQWLVFAAGCAVVLAALLQLWVLVGRGYLSSLEMAARSPAARRILHGLAWYGHAARSVILALLGYFLARAGLEHDAEEVGDTDTAFDLIGGGAIGDFGFLVVALGTIAYGLFMYACAAFYRFEGAPRVAPPHAGDAQPRRQNSAPIPPIDSDTVRTDNPRRVRRPDAV